MPTSLIGSISSFQSGAQGVGAVSQVQKIKAEETARNNDFSNSDQKVAENSAKNTTAAEAVKPVVAASFFEIDSDKAVNKAESALLAKKAFEAAANLFQEGAGDENNPSALESAVEVFQSVDFAA